MELEIVISGICSLVNLDNQDETVIGPSVILLNANPKTIPAHGRPGHIHPKGDVKHIPYLAFDTRRVRVDNDKGFNPLKDAPDYKFLRLHGAEIVVENDSPGVPVVDATYANVVSNDLYWPEAKGRWNNDVVPLRGERPVKSAVSSMMRFGSGRISGGRLCPYKWRFTTTRGETIARHFAEEAIYTFEDTERDSFRITLRDLEDPERDIRTMEFCPQNPGEKVTLFLGNNIAADMPASVRRRRAKLDTGPNHHFLFFNATVDPFIQIPRLPTPVPVASEGVFMGGGGTDGGICGPKNG
ncbi:MAG TPA: hypothetical protein VE974_15240 [Thermoanaerobaculia bacterium]|nr:hypothetical protein [Thermoanaerobaculia bacterium]